MMNKICASSLLVFASIFFANAEGVVNTKEMMRGAPEMSGQMREVKNGQVMQAKELRGSTGANMKPVSPQQNQNGGMGMGQGEAVRMMPPIDMMTTGDPAIDAQLKALIKEKDAKIKAVQDEYLAKIKIIIGNHTLNRNGGMPRGDMHNGTSSMGINREEYRMGASTTPNGPPMMRGDGENEVRGRENRPQQAYRRPPVKMDDDIEQSQPTGEGIKGFFRSIFGGN